MKAAAVEKNTNHIKDNGNKYLYFISQLKWVATLNLIK